MCDVARLALPYCHSLLPPLWGIAASFLDPAELWFYAELIPYQPRQHHPVIFKYIVENNHVHMLDVFCKIDTYFSDDDIKFIIRHDRVEIMAWLLANFPRPIKDYYGMKFATSTYEGAIKILVWENETKLAQWDAGTCSDLAFHNHFDALRRLHECSVPWDYVTYCWAVSSGNVEMVKWIESVDPSITGIDVIYRIGTMPMFLHFIDRAISERRDVEPFINRLCDDASQEMFRRAIHSRVLEKFWPEDDVVYWEALRTEDVEKVKIAVDFGYPLPGPDDILPGSARPMQECPESVGWRG